jgi:hypothetical protein
VCTKETMVEAVADRLKRTSVAAEHEADSLGEWVTASSRVIFGLHLLDGPLGVGVTASFDLKSLMVLDIPWCNVNSRMNCEQEQQRRSTTRGAAAMATRSARSARSAEYETMVWCADQSRAGRTMSSFALTWQKFRCLPRQRKPRGGVRVWLPVVLARAMP